jgi:hypothetical protein
MKAFFKIIAWLGLAVFALAITLSFSESFKFTFAEPGRYGVLMGSYFALIIGLAGLVLMLIGGLVARPGYFWLGCVIMGVLYSTSFFVIYLDWPERIHDNQFGVFVMELAIVILPGLAAVIEGIGLKVIRGKTIP